MTPPLVTPVAVTPDGRLYRPDGSRVDGLDPARVLRAIADIDAGRHRPLAEVVAERGLSPADPASPTEPRR